MKTVRLFKQDVYMKTAKAQITSVSSKAGKTLITLDQTIFFPTGGGQSCDKGTIENINVLDVYEKDDEIYHQIEGTENVLKLGQTVFLQLDWNHRFDNMQRHCGEHILTGIFHEKFGGVNRGFHMGDQYMTIDISLEGNSEFDKITWDMAKQAELAANNVIWQNLPVITRLFDNKRDAENLPLRKPLAIDEDITIVCVGSIENPSDCVACCGTHPSTAGQVGLIKVYKVESNKGMFRIYFEAGKRALEKYQMQFDILTTLENQLSSGTEDLMDKYKAQQEKNKKARTQLHLLKKEVIKREVVDIKSLMTSSHQLITRAYNLLSGDDISAIARELSDSIPKILFLIHKPTLTVFLCSSSKSQIDCGKLVKDNASIYGGKGGGNKTLARAIFNKEEYIDVFIDLIEKHLR
ncbi:MAG: hypothetical protein HFE74_03280 [Firmicutes bacterium]|jgi:alanyl-tRNA synthetase|nr:hypothetical protein [Bacillota bacterium]